MSKKIEIFTEEEGIKILVNGKLYIKEEIEDEDLAKIVINYLKETQEYKNLDRIVNTELRFETKCDTFGNTQIPVIRIPVPNSNTEWSVAAFELVIRFAKDLHILNSSGWIQHFEGEKDIFLRIRS